MIFVAGAVFILLFPLSDQGSVALVLGIAFLIVVSCLLRRRFPAVNGKDGLFLAYAGFALLPLVSDPSQTPYFVGIVVYPWLISFVFQNIRYDERRVQLYLYALMAVSILLGAFMVFQVAPLQFDFSLTHLVSLDRGQGFFFRDEDRVGPNTVAYVSAAAIVFVLTYLKFSRDHTSFLLYGILMIPTLFLVVSGGRNAWVGTTVCFIAFLLYRSGIRSQNLVRAFQATLIIAAVAVTAYLTSVAVSAFHGDTFANRLRGLADLGSDETTQVRLLYWADAITLSLRAPWGVGFNEYFSRYDRSPHNELLGQMLGAGWLGAVVYFVLLAFLWHRVLRMDRTNRMSNQIRFACLCLLVVATLAMVTENISRSTINSFSTVFWISMGMAFGIQNQR
ncbi:MAG TPA: O-antigen ligase family protein, partial [Longimicrobiales bacterium]|nr:O-antigen ligase family protein [Longimicrobiales bacterium]